MHSPKDTTGPLRKLALPNKGPYVITRLTETNAFVVPCNQPKASAKCVAWNGIRPRPDGLCQSKSRMTAQEPEEPVSDAGMSTSELSTGAKGAEVTASRPDEATVIWKGWLRPRMKLLNVTTRMSDLERGRCNNCPGINPPSNRGHRHWGGRETMMKSLPWRLSLPGETRAWI